MQPSNSEGYYKFTISQMIGFQGFGDTIYLGTPAVGLKYRSL